MAKPATAVVTAMEGEGYYNRNSAMQAAGIAAILPLWREAVRAVPFGGEDLVIADYGASQGRNSMEPMRLAIGELRARAGATRPIEIVHTDLPSNDFAALFQALGDKDVTYLVGDANLFPSAVGRSYFELVLPPSRVHLGWNTWTIQWMSRNVLAPDHVFAFRSKVESVVAEVKDQQAKDWRLFLTRRAIEMRPGARLLCLFPGESPDQKGWVWLGDTLWETILEFGGEGRLSEDERQRMTVPTAPRSQEDILAPFKSGSFMGLTLQHVELMAGEDPHFDPYVASGDPAPLAASWSGTMRAFSGPVLQAALDSARLDKEALMDALFERYEARLAAAPRRHEHYVFVVLLAKNLG